MTLHKTVTRHAVRSAFTLMEILIVVAIIVALAGVGAFYVIPQLGKSNEKLAKEVLAKELKLTDPKIIDQGYANFKAETPPNAEIDPTGAENILKAVAPANASRNLNDYIDTTLFAELRGEGFIAAMEKKYGNK